MISVNQIEHVLKDYEQEKNRTLESLFELISFFGMEYPGIIKIEPFYLEKENDDAKKEFFKDNKESYIILVTRKACYKVSYDPKVSSNTGLLIPINVLCAILFIVLMFVFLYIREKVIRPFTQFSELPFELSKGNLSTPLKEQKNHYFGRFLWGMDLLRENIEGNKLKELELQREKKLLLLSLSHDIETPLSAIMLYSNF